jgi:hypothetical protein
MQTQTTEPLTRDMILELRDDAGNAGDSEMVETCEDAMHYEPIHPEWSREYWMDARRQCAAAITEARAADDSKSFVRVVAD